MLERNHFHNTTNEPDQLALKYDAIAKGQEGIILLHFKSRPYIWYNAEEIGSLVFFGDKRPPPRSSIARALANLTRDGYIRKSCYADSVSSYNRACYSWSLNERRTP